MNTACFTELGISRPGERSNASASLGDGAVLRVKRNLNTCLPLLSSNHWSRSKNSPLYVQMLGLSFSYTLIRSASFSPSLKAFAAAAKIPLRVFLPLGKNPGYGKVVGYPTLLEELMTSLIALTLFISLTNIQILSSPNG